VDIMKEAMPEPEKIPIDETRPGYDPDREEYIRQLVEQMRATTDPVEIDRIQRRLYEFIIGEPLSANAEN
jgi:hypothetical protein